MGEGSAIPPTRSSSPCVREPGVHARDDGYGPEPGAERHHRSRFGQGDGERALRVGSYRRFVAMYGDVVLGLKPVHKNEEDPFEVILEQVKHDAAAKYDTDLTTGDLKKLVKLFKDEIKKRLGVEFPEEVHEQLWGAIGAVFGSWMNDRAIAYRKLYDIPGDWGTAVNVQTMVFGNRGETSGTGVGFTRDPALGDNRMTGEFLINAQGEDVVAGIRTPRPIAQLESIMPEAYHELVAIQSRLESHFRDMQDFEFTIEDKKLWMLQTRTGKRHPFAAARMAVDMETEGLITEKEAVLRPDADGIAAFLSPIFDQTAKASAVREGRVIAKGLPAGPGGASGRVTFNAADAEAWANRGEKVLLVRKFTSPEDIRGMNAAQGILTAMGGMTSHAALVARQMGKVCIVGCGELDMDYEKAQMVVGDKVVKEGDWLSIDGFTAEVILGQLPTQPSEVVQVLSGELKAENSRNYQQFTKLMIWADKHRKLQVWTNADTPGQAELAVKLGAEGIGLCRTEHMFFEGERIQYVRSMILSETKEDRQKALAFLFPMQKADFAGIFKAMNGRPVTVRLLDPPLHEFLPSREALKPEVFEEKVKAVAEELKVSPAEIEARIEALHENNPMLGHRGCRLGVTYPEIYEMQIKAIVEAACDVAEAGIPVKPEIMIPIVATLPGDEDLRRYDPAHRRRGHRQGQGQAQGALPRGDHDRTAARMRRGGSDRQVRRVLQLRHQRPHPDHLRNLQGRRPRLPGRVLSTAKFTETTPSSASTGRAWASS